MLRGEIRSPANKISLVRRGRNQVFLGKSFVFTQRLSKKAVFFVGSASRTENIEFFLIWGYLESLKIDLADYQLAVFATSKKMEASELSRGYSPNFRPKLKLR